MKHGYLTVRVTFEINKCYSLSKIARIVRSVMTGYDLDNLCFILSRARDSSLFHHICSGCSVHPLLIQWTFSALSPRVRQSKFEAGPFTSKVMNVWSITSTSSLFLHGTGKILFYLFLYKYCLKVHPSPSSVSVYHTIKV